MPLPLAISSKVQPAPALPDWKALLISERNALKERFFEVGAAAQLLRRLSLLADRCLRDVWRRCEMPSSLALVAVGGYGRGQLFPHSDVDILIVLPDVATEDPRHKLEKLVGVLWDIGLEVGHSVRTIDECIELAQQDITIQTTLLESRLIAGDRSLFRSFVRRTAAELDSGLFYQAKVLEQQQRHARYEQSSLEPNVKESRGGLRDLQNVLWISRASDVGAAWSQLAHRGIISRQEEREIKRHEHFLQTLRIRLHYLAARREDRLLFDYQSALAAQFGFEDAGPRLASEQLMQRYYRAANAVAQITTIVLQNLGARVLPAADSVLRPINERFGMRGALLEARDEQLYEHDPHAIFETFVLLQQYREAKDIAAPTLRALWRARRMIGTAFRREPVNREIFMRILRSPSHVLRMLKRMHEYGILGRYIPAFGRIIGQMQHDLYHVHTVDEHILKVVRNLRRFAVVELAHEFPLCSRLMSDFPRPEVLYIAGLFHDIAKGRGGDHSMLGKIDALRFCMTHGVSREDSELVAWLVEQHLMMSATAQKQDLSDLDVIRAFAERVSDERRLVALYLLTVADIRGTSPRVWNAWKAKLLEDLFLATQRLLSGDHMALQSSEESRRAEAETKLRLYAVPENAHQKLWSELDTSYFLRHDAAEIAWHARLLYYRVQSRKPVVKARLSPAGEGLQVMVYVPDQKELFARICSFFERINYDVFEAKIYTTRHGYALDTFHVQDPDNREPHYRDLMSYIEYELAERLEHQTPLPALTRPRLNRQLRHFPISPEVSIQPDEKGTYQVLSIIAGDRPGLLSRIARVFIAYDINLHTARINTLGARAEDTFLITGAALKDSKRVVRLESDLLEQVRT